MAAGTGMGDEVHVVAHISGSGSENGSAIEAASGVGSEAAIAWESESVTVHAGRHIVERARYAGWHTAEQARHKGRNLQGVDLVVGISSMWELCPPLASVSPSRSVSTAQVGAAPVQCARLRSDIGTGIVADAVGFAEDAEGAAVNAADEAGGDVEDVVDAEGDVVDVVGVPRLRSWVSRSATSGADFEQELHPRGLP